MLTQSQLSIKPILRQEPTLGNRLDYVALCIKEEISLSLMIL